MRNILLLLLTTTLFISCDSISGKGDIIKESRKTGTFDAIKNSGSIDVKIIVGDNYNIEVEDYENLLPHIVTDVDNGVLEIHYENGINISNSNATVFVTVPTLKRIITSGSSATEISGVIKNTKGLEFSVTGSGSIEGTVDAPSVELKITGSGEMDLKGVTQTMECKITGSGDFDGRDLKSENCTITVSGSGNAKVFASVSLKAKVSGSGDIIYGGNPPDTKIEKSGSGTISQEK